MYASATIAATTAEIRPTRHIGSGEDRQTVRVRPGRSNARRRAIADSWRNAR